MVGALWIYAKLRCVRHTAAMRRGVWILALGVFLAASGTASALASGAASSTTTTSTSTTSTTSTTTGTTTPPPPTYSRLVPAYLPRGCVGAGAAAIAEPGRTVLTLGTPAASRGPSAYPGTAPIVRFLSSSASGAGCTGSRVALDSVALFGGAVTARSVEATHGRGTATGLSIFGSPVALAPGRPARVGGWGEVTLDKTVGRLTAPLVVQLLAAHRGLPAGTTIALAFAASPQPAAEPKREQPAAGPPRHGKKAKPQRSRPHAGKKHRRGKRVLPQPLTAVPELGFRPSHYVFPIDGGASYVDTYGANRSEIYDGWHHGDDLFAPLGTPVVAVAKGKLSLVGWNKLGGWRLWLTDRKGNTFYYAHLAGYARWILTHRRVRAGQVIGFVGRTGDAFTTPPHVHFEVHPHQPAFVKLGYDGAVDPTTYLQKWRVERVPADEVPRPAKLRAPAGTPRKQAAVVWRQLLAARRLAPKRSPRTRDSTRRLFPHPPSFLASGGPPPPVVRVRPTSGQVSASESKLPLLVGGPLVGLVALSGAAGVFLFRRRRSETAAEAPPAAEPSS